MNQILYNFIYEKINYNYVREGINVDLCSEFNINVYLDLFLAGNDKINKMYVIIPRRVMLAMPVPLMPSVRLAMNSHWDDAQRMEETLQIPDILTTWHTGLDKSVAWKKREKGDQVVRTAKEQEQKKSGIDATLYLCSFILSAFSFVFEYYL